MPDPTIRSSSLPAEFAATTNTTITAPAGITDGDGLLIAHICGASSAAPAVTPPAGFTQIGTTLTGNSGGYFASLRAFYKRAASESGNYTLTHSAGDGQGSMYCIRDTTASGAFIGNTSQNSGNSATTTGTGITLSSGSLLFAFFADFVWAGGLTPPTGMTESVDDANYIAFQTNMSGGASGDKTMTNGNGSALPFYAYLVEVLAEPWPPAGAGDAASKLKVITTGMRW